MSILANPPASFAGRKVGVLVAKGFDAALLTELNADLQGEGAMVELIAPTVGGAISGDGTQVAAHHAVEGAPSVLFDAVCLLMPRPGAEALCRETPALDFVKDAFVHCKVIGFSQGAVPLLAAAGVLPDADEGMLELRAGSAAEYVALCRRMRIWGREMAAGL